MTSSSNRVLQSSFAAINRFGIITPTYSLKKNYQLIREYINRYATMDCPEIEEIVIVWNNEENPKDLGFKQLEEWKRPVLFHKTPKNSMDLRYSLPSESRAKVFFSADDDIITTCFELQKGFEEWKKKCCRGYCSSAGLWA